MLPAQIFKIKDVVEEVSGIASGEYALELQLEKIEKVILQSLMSWSILSHLHWIFSSHAYIITLTFVRFQAWKDLSFAVKNYRDTKDVFILGGLDEVFAQVIEVLFPVLKTLHLSTCQ